MIQNKNQEHNLPLVIAQFAIEGSPATIVPFGSGHIHDTFRVVNTRRESPDYILQRINHHVFQKVAALTENIQLVTAHLRDKLKEIKGAEADKEVLSPIPTKAGKGVYQDEEGNYWRMYYFLKNTRSYDLVQTVQQAYEGGRAYGRFQFLLSDMDPARLQETIPRFHDMENRLQLFKEALERDPKGRVKDVQAEISFVNKRAAFMATIGRLGREGKLLLRITHNDTKFNNVLLNEQDKAQCVIDLDTVMPGYMAYDFGDAIRTIVNKASEDEKELDKIEIDVQLFEGFTKGFLEETGSFISDAEVQSLSLGALMLPFIMGLRFLTDYVNGDTYYKIHFPEHNIQRSRAQFRLVEKLEEQYDLLQDIIRKTAKLNRPQ